MPVVNIPIRYKDLRGTLSDEVSFGCGGIRLFSTAEIAAQQLGYSVAPDGSSLCTGAEGAWQPSWLVIGYETGLGDPIFIDIEDAVLPVFTAMHGEGPWKPNSIARSIDSFTKCLAEFSKIAQGRGSPNEHDANPVSPEERKRFLDRIAKHNGTANAPEFWDVLLEF